jgi:hypothetical protein
MRTDIAAFWRRPARSTMAVALLLTCGAVTTGCTRTDDGTMLLNRPSMSLGFGRWSERIAERRRARAAEQTAELTTFPAAPPPPVVAAATPEPQVARRAPVRRATQPPRASQQARAIRRGPIRATDVRAPRIGVQAPFKTSEKSKPLTCTDMAQAAQTGGRVKISCQ